MKCFFVFFLATLSYCACSQTGPGGVGNSTTNVLWLSADNGVYSNAGTTLATNNTNVQQWNDRSGNGRNAIQNTAGNRPNYFNTGAANTINGLPLIRFTETTDDRMLSTSVTTGNAASLFIVARYSSLPNGNNGLIQGSPAGLAFSVNPGDKSVGIWISNSTQPWGRGVQSNTTQRDIPQTTNTTTDTWYIFNNIYGSGNINQYISGATAGNITYNNTLQDWSDVGIGMQGNEGWNGDFAEVIAYNFGLNMAQRIIVDNYLAAKYNLSITNDRWLVTTTHNYDVAGIGQATDGTNHTDAQSSIVRISNPTGLANNEYYLWGHDNGALTPTTSNLPTGLYERITRIWRGSETAAGAASNSITNFTVRVDLTGIGNLPAANLRLIVDTNNNNSFADETAGGGGVITANSVSGSVYTFNNVTALNNNLRFTFASITVPLPIELASFKAQEEEDKVKLTWSTSSEINNDYFTIERSMDGQRFEYVGRITGAGNSTETKNYSLIDDNPFQGKSYYRLSQTDYDGTKKYFPLVSVNLESADAEFILHPNPSDGEVYLDIKHAQDGKELNIALFDIQGKQIYSLQPYSVGSKVTTSFRLTTNHPLSPGIYLVKINYGDEQTIKRLVIE